MLHSKAVNSLENFKRLNGSVYIHDPTTTTSSENHPDLILIAGWMNASPRHISKYTAGYQKLYPSARILAITTTSVDAVFTTHGANLKRIAPVLDILYTLHPNSKLLHVAPILKLLNTPPAPLANSRLIEFRIRDSGTGKERTEVVMIIPYFQMS